MVEQWRNRHRLREYISGALSVNPEQDVGENKQQTYSHGESYTVGPGNRYTLTLHWTLAWDFRALSDLCCCYVTIPDSYVASIWLFLTVMLRLCNYSWQLCCQYLTIPDSHDACFCLICRHLAAGEPAWRWRLYPISSEVEESNSLPWYVYW